MPLNVLLNVINMRRLGVALALTVKLEDLKPGLNAWSVSSFIRFYMLPVVLYMEESVIIYNNRIILKYNNKIE